VRVLVIFAHPRADSFCAALHGAVLAALRDAGHAVDDLDLYAERFDPVLSAAERGVYHSVGGNLAGIEGYVARLRAAEALVICAPTWWYGMPAILKGYFDRVWVPGIAFTLTPGGGPILPGLTHIRKLAVVTTAGSPWWFTRLLIGDPARKVLVRGLRRLFAPRAQITYLVHHAMDSSTPRSRARFLARIQRAMERF
jgi:NAD(P)H dehydrogenase (quinone)